MEERDPFRPDDDNPELTDEQLLDLQPASEVLDAATMSALRRLRGPQKAPTKAQVTLRIDRDVLDHFRAGGPGWQSRLNAALRAAVAAGRSSA